MRNIGKIINNQEIIDIFWSSNTPQEVIQCLIENDLKNVAMNNKQFTCGLIISRDVNTKEAILTFGITEIKNKKEDVEFIMNYGQRLKKVHLQNLIELLTNKEGND